MSPTEQVPKRLLYPVCEARELLGGIGHTFFYTLVKAGDIKLVKIRGRSFVSASELRRISGQKPDAS